MAELAGTPDAASLLASLARHIPGAIYRCALDASWTMHLIGDEIERITGYPAGDFVENRRRTFESVIHEDDRERVRRDVADAVAQNRPFELEYRVRTATGEERWILERGCAVQGAEREWLDGILFDITERRQFEHAARRAEAEAAVAAELAASRRRIVVAADEARRQLERDLHDGAQQSLVSSLVLLRTACRALSDDPARATALLGTAEEQLEQALRELRDFAHGIHPVLLSKRGVCAAVEGLVARSTVPVELVDRLQRRLPTDVETALYFTVAEALTNATKHARATRLSVRLAAEDGCAVADVSDDGVGGMDHAGTGLRGLADRLATVGGTLEIVARPGAGTRLIARVPLDQLASSAGTSAIESTTAVGSTPLL